MGIEGHVICNYRYNNIKFRAGLVLSIRVDPAEYASRQVQDLPSGSQSWPPQDSHNDAHNLEDWYT